MQPHVTALWQEPDQRDQRVLGAGQQVVVVDEDEQQRPGPPVPAAQLLG
nr:hypothetical protein [Parafrankia sp. CH37]